MQVERHKKYIEEIKHVSFNIYMLWLRKVDFIEENKNIKWSGACK